MLKIVKVQEGTVVAEVATKKEAAEFILANVTTDNSLKTVQKKVTEAVKSGEAVYETFKIEEEEVKMEEIKNEEVVVEEVKAEETAEETVETPAETEVEVVEETDEVSEKAAKKLEEEVEKLRKEEKKKESKRTAGKTLIGYIDGEEVEKFKSIKAATLWLKEKEGLPHMPFTAVMKSARDGIDFNQYSFKFEDPADLHIPTSRKVKEKHAEDKGFTKVTDEDLAKDQKELEENGDIEEIVEVEVEETI